MTKNVKMCSSNLWLLVSCCALLVRASHDWDIVTRNSNNFLYKGQMVRAEDTRERGWWMVVSKNAFHFRGVEMIMVAGGSLQFIIRVRKAISALLHRQPSI